ncbi:MAG: hypothetical protein ACK52J_02595 [bacterium]
MYLVPGDIIYVNGGEKIFADVRILESNCLRANNISITGDN